MGKTEKQADNPIKGIIRILHKAVHLAKIVVPTTLILLLVGIFMSAKEGEINKAYTGISKIIEISDELTRDAISQNSKYGRGEIKDKEDKLVELYGKLPGNLPKQFKACIESLIGRARLAHAELYDKREVAMREFEHKIARAKRAANHWYWEEFLFDFYPGGKKEIEC